MNWFFVLMCFALVYHLIFTEGILQNDSMQLKKLTDQRSRSKSHKEKTDLTLEIALHYSELGEHDEALTEYKKLLDLFMEKDDRSQWAVAHRLIADCCIELGDFAQAIRHTNDYLKLSIETNNKLEQQRAYVTLGRCFLNRAEQVKDGDEMMKNLKSSSQALLNSIKLIGGLASSLSSGELGEMRAVSLLNLGQVFRAQRDYTSASDRFSQCISLARKYHFQKLLFRACYQFSDLTLSLPPLSIYEPIGRSALLTQLEHSPVSRALEVVSLTMHSPMAKSCLDVESKDLLRSLQESYANIYLCLGQFRKAAKVYRLLKLNYPSLSDVCRGLIRKSMLLSNELQQLPDSISTSFESHMLVARTHEKLGDLYAGIELHGSALIHYRLMLVNAEHAYRLYSTSAITATSGTDQTNDVAKLVDAALISVAETYRALADYDQCVQTYRKEIQWVISHGLPTADLAGSWFSLAQAQRLCFSRSSSVVTNESVLPGSESTVETLNSALRAAQQSSVQPLVSDILAELEDYYTCHNQTAMSTQLREQISKLDINSASEDVNGSSQSTDCDDNMNVSEETLTQYIEGLSSDSEIDSCILHNELSDEFHGGQRGSRKSKALCLKTNMKGETPLHVAAISGDMDHVVKLIEILGHPVNVTDGAGWLPIHEAAFHDRTEVAVYLLDRGARLDDPGCPMDESTPLFEAIHNGSLATALVLVGRGANLWHRNKRGECLPELLDLWQPSRRCSGTFGEQRVLFEQLLTAIRERLQGDYEQWCNQPRSTASQLSSSSPSSVSPEQEHSPKSKRARRRPRSPSPSLSETVLHQQCEQNPKALRSHQLNYLPDGFNKVTTTPGPSRRAGPSKSKEAVESYKAAMRAISGATSRTGKNTANPEQTVIRKKRLSLPSVDMDDQDWLIEDQSPGRTVRSRASGSTTSRSHFDSKNVRASNKRTKVIDQPNFCESPESFLPLRNVTHTQNIANQRFAPQDEGFTSTQLPKSSSPVKPTFHQAVPTKVALDTDCHTSELGRLPASSQPVVSTSSSTGPFPIKVAFADVSVLVPVDDSSRSIAWIAGEAYRRRQILTSLPNKAISTEDSSGRVRLSTRDGALLLHSDRLSSVLASLAINRGAVIELLAELVEPPGPGDTSTCSRSITKSSYIIPLSDGLASIETMQKPRPATTHAVSLNMDKVSHITTSSFFKELLIHVRQSGSIDLRFLALGDEDCGILLSQLRLHGIRAVSELHLQGNCLTLDQPAGSMWVEFISQVADQLTVLCLDSNALTPGSIDSLLERLGPLPKQTAQSSRNITSLPRLQRLSLAYNPLLGSGDIRKFDADGDASFDCHTSWLSVVRRLVSSLPKMSVLSLAGCCLGLNGQQIRSEFSCLDSTGLTVSALSELNLSWNPQIPIEDISSILSCGVFAGLKTVSLRGCCSSPRYWDCQTTLPLTPDQYSSCQWCLPSEKQRSTPAFPVYESPTHGDDLVHAFAALMTKGHFHLQSLDMGFCHLSHHCIPALKILFDTPGTSLTTICVDHNPGLATVDSMGSGNPVWCEVVRSSASAASALVSLTIDMPKVNDDDDALSAVIVAVERKLLLGLCPTPLQKLVLLGAPLDWHPINSLINTVVESDRRQPSALTNGHRLCNALVNLFSTRFGTLSRCRREKNALMFGIL